MPAAIAIPALISAGASVGGGVIASRAAGNASRAQQQAAQQAGDTVGAAVGEVNPWIRGAYEAAANGVTSAANTAADGVLEAGQNAATGMYDATAAANAHLNPYAQAGQGAVGSLASLLQNPQEFRFDPNEDPGAQFVLQQGLQALERSAAARGGALGGAAAKSAMRYAGGLAGQQFAAAFDRFDRNRQVQLNGLSALSGMGLQAGGQMGQNQIGAAQFGGAMNFDASRIAGGLRTGAAEYAGNMGFAGTNQIANNTIEAARFRGGAQIGAGDARAAGIVGAGNAWNGALSGVGNAAMSASLTNIIRGGGAPAVGGGFGTPAAPAAAAPNFQIVPPRYTIPNGSR